MAFLGALSSAVGILSSIQQNNAARRQQALAAQQQAEALKQQQAYENQLNQQYQNNVASGVYNPAAINDLYRQTFQNALHNNLNDANVSLTNAGARAGDSMLNVANQNISENNALGLAGAIQQATTAAQQRQQQDLYGTNPAQYTNMLMGAGNTNYQRGYQNMVDPSGLLANITQPGAFSWLNHNSTTPVGTYPNGNNGFGVNNVQNPDGSYQMPDQSDALSGIKNYLSGLGNQRFY